MDTNGSASTTHGTIDRIERALQSVGVRALLSVLILASLVPHPDDHLTDLLFLGVFGLELTLRLVVLVRRRGARDVRTTRQRALSGVFLALDLLALSTFVPWAGLTGLTDARWLRLLRLLRLLLLIGYWSPVWRDTWAVLSRHDRMRQLTLLGLIVMLFAFAGATVLSHLPVGGTDFDGDAAIDADDAHFWPRLWWAFRQVQDPGNMVGDPGEIAVVLVSLLLTVAGVFVVSFLIGLATDVVRELVTLARNRPLGWKDHTVIVHATPGLPRLLAELTGYYERLFRRPRFVVADLAEEPPAALRTGALAAVRWRQIDARGEGLVEHADVQNARRVVVLAKADAPFPDAHVAATVLDVREANARAWLVVEVLDPNNAAAARVAGGARTVVVATDKLLGLWTLAAIARAEQIPIAWELLATRGGSEIYSCFLDADGLDGPGTPWMPPLTPLSDVVEAALSDRWRGPGGRQERGAVVPLGVVYGRHGQRFGEAHDEGELVLGPERVEAHPVRALVAIGDHFDEVQRFTLALHRGAVAPSRNETVGAAPDLGAPTRVAHPRKVLMCGFRPGSVVVAAGLLGEPGTTIVLVMRHEESVRQAAQAFREHGLGERRGRCFSGRFEERGQRFEWRPDDAPAGEPGTVTLAQADWTSERTLAGHEPGIGHVADYDLVLLMGAHGPEYDGRNAIACLKIADLARAHPGRFGEGFRVVAGIADRELGRRLEERYARAAASRGLRLEVIPTEDLRALFVFQSIAVPGWEWIFLDLLGPGGQGFIRLPLVAPGEGDWSFGELARALAGRGVLVGLELVDGTRRYAPPPAWRFAERDLAAVWLLAPEA